MKKKRAYDMTARTAKTEATKQRICDVTVQLYAEREIEDFTLEDVAERADTTVQTVLRIFGSKDELVYAALERMSSAGVPLRLTPPGDVAAAVHAIYDLYEGVGDLVIRRLADQHRRPHFQPMLAEGRLQHRRWLQHVFAPQLERERGPARMQLFNALIAATDVATWNVLRRDTGLSRAAAEAVVQRLIDGVLPNEENTHGRHPVAELVGRR